MRKTEQARVNKMKRVEQIAFVKKHYPQRSNNKIIVDLNMNKSYFYRLLSVAKQSATA